MIETSIKNNIITAQNQPEVSEYVTGRSLAYMAALGWMLDLEHEQPVLAENSTILTDERFIAIIEKRVRATKAKKPKRA